MGLIFNGDRIKKITIDPATNTVIFDSQTPIIGIPDDGIIHLNPRAMDGLASYVFKKSMECYDPVAIERIVDDAIETCDGMMDNAVAKMIKELEAKMRIDLSEKDKNDMKNEMRTSTIEHCKSLVISHLIHTSHITFINLNPETIMMVQRKVDSIVSTKILNARFTNAFKSDKEDQ